MKREHDLAKTLYKKIFFIMNLNFDISMPFCISYNQDGIETNGKRRVFFLLRISLLLDEKKYFFEPHSISVSLVTGEFSFPFTV